MAFLHVLSRSTSTRVATGTASKRCSIHAQGSFPSLSCQQSTTAIPTRSASSNAAAAAARPRLAALQEQLQKDHKEENIVKLWNKKKPKASNTTTTTASSDTSTSLQELKNYIDTLPDIDNLQETMLVDKYNRHHAYLRLSLVEKCNLRCQYCMPPEGVPLNPPSHLLSTSELLHLTQFFIKSGVTKIRLTGGEPLLRRDLVEICSQLSLFPELQQIGITTNGVTLRHKLQDLHQAGLTHINISLDTLDPTKFQQLTRRNAFDKVWSSIQAACHLYPAGRIKINMVVMRGINEKEIADFCLLTRQFPNMDVRFIEWMPFHDNGWDTEKFIPYQELLSGLQKEHGIELQRIQDGPNDTTKWYKLNDNDSSTGRIGFITSMSEHFCSTCNRLRLTADGQIKVCLFGSQEVSLRDALRGGFSSKEMQKLIHYAVQKKTFALGGHGSAVNIAKANNNRPMTLIGG